MKKSTKNSITENFKEFLSELDGANPTVAEAFSAGALSTLATLQTAEDFDETFEDLLSEATKIALTFLSEFSQRASSTASFH